MKKSEINKLYDKLIENMIQLTNLEFSINDRAIKDTGTSLQEDLKFASRFRKNKDISNIKKFNNIFHFEKKFFELLIIQHESLWIIFVKYFYYKKEKIELNVYNKRRMLFYLLILNNQINNLISMLQLLERGYSQSSDLIFRNYMEIAEKGLAILSDNDYYEAYKKETFNEDEDKEIWKKTKPYLTFEIVKRALLKIENVEFYNMFFTVRETLYTNTSKTVHGNIKSILKGAILVEDESDYMKLNIYGNVNSNFQDNLTNYFIYSKIVSQAVIIILVKDYKLNFDKFKEEGKHHVFIQSLTDKIFKMYFDVRIISQTKSNNS